MGMSRWRWNAWTGSYLNGYIGKLATSGGLVTFMREQLGKPIPSPVVLVQVTERFREAGRNQSRAGVHSDLPVRPQGAEERCRQPDAPATRRAGRNCVHRSGAGESAGLQRQEDRRTVRVH